MILFEIKGKNYKDSIYSETEFITAVKSSQAINKFLEIHPSCEFIESMIICNREDIIPTVEPIKEV
jgi:hypothetical protein